MPKEQFYLEKTFSDTIPNKNFSVNKRIEPGFSIRVLITAEWK
jgi:hypothetical protein